MLRSCLPPADRLDGDSQRCDDRRRSHRSPAA